MARRSPDKKTKPVRRDWTPAADAFLRRHRLQGLTYGEIADHLARAAYGHWSVPAVASRAKALGFTGRLPSLRHEEGARDCRDADGEDRLLARLVAVHKVAPADARPSVRDGERIDLWAVTPVLGCAGSPAAACAEG